MSAHPGRPSTRRTPNWHNATGSRRASTACCLGTPPPPQACTFMTGHRAHASSMVGHVGRQRFPDWGPRPMGAIVRALMPSVRLGSATVRHGSVHAAPATLTNLDYLYTSSAGERYRWPIRTARVLLELTTVEPYQQQLLAGNNERVRTSWAMKPPPLLSSSI